MENEYEIEIVDFNAIDGGIEVFARAWKNGVQLGFGNDGTIDIERFRFINPPILVDDPLGDIVIDGCLDPATNEVSGGRILREDPAEALRQALTHTISIVGKVGTNIIEGKRGNTTTTFYAGAGDGRTRYAEGSGSWATVHDATTCSTVDPTATQTYFGSEYHTTYYNLGRLFLPFDTSALPDTDTIDSATVSIHSYQQALDNDNDAQGYMAIIQTTQASNTTLATTDYDNVGTTKGATDIDLTDIRAAGVAFTDWTLNATGLSWISKTGYTKLGIREGHDLENSAINAANYNIMYVDLSEQTGTTSDPKLVVVHSAGAATFTPKASFFM